MYSDARGEVHSSFGAVQKHVSDSVFVLLCLLSGDGFILICSSCDLGVPKSQPI